MCGIVGFISNSGHVGYPGDRATFLKQGLVVDTLRGYDSTGVYLVRTGREKEKAYWEKDSLSAGEFVSSPAWNKMIGTPSSIW